MRHTDSQNACSVLLVNVFVDECVVLAGMVAYTCVGAGAGLGAAVANAGTGADASARADVGV